MVNQPIEFKEKITNCGGYHRCCYLLKDGTRCKNPAMGLRRIQGKLSYALQCKQHVGECDKSYKKYKESCSSLFTNNLDNLNKCQKRFKTKVFNRVSNIQDCMAQRILWPKRCTYGCLKEPCSKEAKKLLLSHDDKHEHILKKLLKCKKNITHQ